MNKDEARRRLKNLDLTADEMKEHFYAMQAEARTPRHVAQVHTRLSFEHEKAEIGLLTYRRFMAKGQYSTNT